MNRLPALLAFVTLAFVTPAIAAPGDAAPSAKSADSLGLEGGAISAKALLEDLLIKRYSQGLSTFIDRQSFTVGAELVLVEKARETEKPEEEEEESALPGDLLLGSIDLDEAMKAAMTPELRAKINQFVGDYRVKTANIRVGLKPSVQSPAKDQIDSWLKQRVNGEFGKSANVTVAYYADPIENQRSFFEKLEQFQGLAGQLVVALAIMAAALMWGLFNSRSQKMEAAERAAATEAAGAGSVNQTGATNSNADGTIETVRNEADEAKAVREIKDYNKRLLGLVPKLASESATLVRSWCDLGDEGMMRMACFSEAVGSEMGKLPVPADSMKELSNAFSRMPEVAPVEKRDLLKKVYWDIMMVLNLGSEALERPFSYVSTMKNTMLQDVLIHQNSRMKTLVAMFMPESLRQQYVSNQDSGTKLELLRQALDMGEIATEELKNYESRFRSSIRTDDRKDVVIIESALQKLISALTPMEEMHLLPQLSGAGIEGFKTAQVSLAFLHEWNDTALGVVFSRAMPDEVVAFLRMRMEFRDRVIGLCPPMTAEVASDDLNRENSFTEKEQNILLNQLAVRVRGLVESGEIQLAAVYQGDLSNDDQSVERNAA